MLRGSRAMTKMTSLLKRNEQFAPTSTPAALRLPTTQAVAAACSSRPCCHRRSASPATCTTSPPGAPPPPRTPGTPARPLTTSHRRSQPMRSKPAILVALLLAAFLVNLDTTLVNVALPAIVRQLHATTTQLQWVVDSYNLVFAALLLTFGSLSDRFGRKGMLLTGLAVA